ncbi:MAG: hypothetical protein IJK26_01070 [Clostridia bacterium]|nr:hypothetical protein [Clostridia bacterium]
MKICSGCGYKNTDTSNFCIECGKSLEPEISNSQQQDNQDNNKKQTSGLALIIIIFAAVLILCSFIGLLLNLNDTHFLAILASIFIILVFVFRLLGAKK